MNKYINFSSGLWCVLLIFVTVFLVNCKKNSIGRENSSEKSITIEAPKINMNESFHIIEIAANNNIYFDNELCNMDNIVPKIIAKGIAVNSKITIKAHINTNYRNVIALVKLLKKNKFSKILIQTIDRKEKAPAL